MNWFAINAAEGGQRNRRRGVNGMEWNEEPPPAPPPPGLPPGTSQAMNNVVPEMGNNVKAADGSNGGGGGFHEHQPWSSKAATDTRPPPDPQQPAPPPPPGQAEGGAGAGNDAGSGSTGGTSGDTPAASGTPGVTNNAGGVPQANAINGVSPQSKQVVQTGTGSDKVYNITNKSGQPESFTYSVHDVPKGRTMTLQPGETGSFVAGSGDLGVRITPTDAAGNKHTNEILYEDGGADNGEAAGVSNPDISKVDGNVDFQGNPLNMTVTLGDGKQAGDGDPIHAYAYSTDDGRSMGLANSPSKTANIVVSDAS